uniref:Vitellogenin-6 n=1 Tax=Sipha flava TaxID=143950 RepID=A0A2S2QLT4_9HEMI
MHDRLGIIVAVASCYLVQSSFCDRDLFPEGFQLGYRWRAITHVGTVFPSEHLTKYSLDAYFSVQTYQNVTTFQIKEFKTSEAQQEFPWITLPFRCSYKDGEVQTFERESADVLGSLNIKRALVGMLQLKLGSPLRPSFVTEETGVYGRCNVQYLVTKENNSTNVKKIVNFSACNNKLGQQWSNTPAFTCPSNYQNGSMSHSVRTYTLDETNTIQYLNVIGTVEFQPFQALAESHHIFVNQTIELEEMVPITDPITLEAKTEDSIEYDFKHYEDPTLGYKSSNKSQLLAEIHDILGQLTESLSWELGTTDLDNQTEFRALELMWWLDTSDWTTLYDTIKIGTSYSQETIQHFFWDLVPQVGSASSVAFIRELIKSQRVTSFLATGLLITFPYHVRYPDEKLLKESEMLLYLDEDNTKAEVRKVAILSFASLIHKTCSKGMCSEDTQNHFIRLFLDKFKESTTHNEQMLYIEAFSNMKIDNTLEFLQPIITDHDRNRHIRLVAIWATKSATTDHPEKVSEVFWPILMNRSEPVEIRTSALNMLMMSQPTVSRFLTLYWFMQEEPSQQIYNFYYTTINSIANSKYPCYNKYRKIASQIVRFVQHKWHHWATGNYLLDYEDPLRGYGGIMQTILVANQRTGLPSLLRLTAEQHSFGMSSEFEIHVKAEGFADSLKIELIGAMANSPGEPVDISKLLELLKKAKLEIQNDEDLHLETIVKINGQTIYCHHLNMTTFNNYALVFRKLSSLYFQFSLNYQRLSFPLRFQQTQFTDFGTPILLQFRTASLLSLRGSIKQTESGKSRDAELDFRYSMNTVTSLKTFNPLSNTWRGADRFRCIHARIPFSTEIIYHYSRSYVKASAYRYKNFVDGSKLGVVWHSATKLFPLENTTSPTIKTDELPLTDVRKIYFFPS